MCPYRGKAAGWLERLKERRRELMHGFIEYLGEEDTVELLLLVSRAV
jgi:hypothetical protein